MKTVELLNLIINGCTLFVLIVTVVAANIIGTKQNEIGAKQNEINEYLKNLEDQVEISTVASPLREKRLDNGTIQKEWDLIFQNAGKVHVYLDSYTTNSENKSLHGVLLPAGNNASLYRLTLLETGQGQNQTFIVHFTDYIGRKWFSKIILERENGGISVRTFKREVENQ